MQRLFSREGPWPTPWMHRVLPVVTELANRHPERTVFTSFIPPKRPEDMPGTWQRYYTRWEQAAREQLDPALLKLLPPLAKLCPPATVVDKTRYSGFAEPHLLSHLQSRATDGLIVTGSETDVCVLSTARMTVRGAPWPVSELSVTVECQSAIVLAGKGKAPACLGGICRGLNSGTAQSHD